MVDDLATLLYQTALGDQRAFDRLYRLTSPQMFGAALALLRRRDLAEDVLQEAYIKVWHAAGTFQPERGSPNAWLGTIVRRCAIDRLRRRPKDGDSLPDEAWDAIADDAPGPLQRVMADADARRLGDCLEQLGDQQRESVSLAFFHGLTHSELAEHLATPLGTVKAWVRRGLDKLRSCLGEVPA
ncbi:MAG: sigma-70 family RNA polymerase sigma factor [Pseudomonadota bacterium]